MTHLVHGNSELRLAMNGLGSNICLVPTMGALHDGHAALIAAGKEFVGKDGCVVVSDFVNPKQFGQNEDFEKYPRNIEQDLKVARSAGAHILWAPSVEDVYPGQWPLDIESDPRFEILEGKSRSGHFAAVLEVVTRLFNIVQPNIAVFGEKDFQQLVFISEMAKKREPQIGILAVPTKRDFDGLALSSRNVYLSSDQRNVAHLIPDALKQGVLLASKGANPQEIKESVKEVISKSNLIEIEYVEILNNELNELIPGVVGRILIAAKLGNTRLIDNMPILLKEKS
jgi:pantoate--beta-alanine ligase